MSIENYYSTPSGRIQNLEGYDRSSETTGVDLLIDFLSDLVTKDGDLSVISGADVITQSLLCRLSTPSNGYRRWVQTHDGLQLRDENYGNGAYLYLSSPSSSENLGLLEKEIKECFAQELRVELLDIKIERQPSLNEILVSLRYRVLSESEIRSLSLTLKN